EEAIKEVVARHEALRAVVSGNGESIIIYKNIPFENTYHDLSSFPDQELQIKTFISNEMQNVFDLQVGPLIRTFIHKLSDTHHYFTVVGHHILCDGWSLGIILENIAKIYNAKLNGKAVALDKADQISDYAIEMAEFKNSKSHEQVKTYWIDLYKDGAPTLDFPTDYARPLNRNFRSNRYDHPISLGLVAKLKKLGAANGSSLVNTLLSAFELFIYLKTNQLDLIVGMPTAGQAATEKFELVGHCVNLLALRSKIDVELSFSNYLVKRKKDFFDAYENQKFTLGELVESLDQKKDYSRIPLLPILFNVDMSLDTSVSFDYLNYELISNPRIFETFEIFLNVTGSKSKFLLEWSYSTQLFKLETIQHISLEFEKLLETLTLEPSISFKDLAARTAAYWDKKLVKWNETHITYQQEESLVNLFGAATDQYGMQCALTFAEKKLSYHDLKKQADKLSKYLVSKGVKIGDVVAIALQPSV
ncbi:MAG: non-ribosomal peptide synthetase, partial [Pedobacter sp.]